MITQFLIMLVTQKILHNYFCLRKKKLICYETMKKIKLKEHKEPIVRAKLGDPF